MIVHEMHYEECKTLVCSNDWEELYDLGWRFTGKRYLVHSRKQYAEMLHVTEELEPEYQLLPPEHDSPFNSDRCYPCDPNDMSIWLFEETVT